MATPEINENCCFMQNDSHKCKIKLEKFYFDILCRFGVIKESLLEGGGRNPPPPGEIGLRRKGQILPPRSERVFKIPVRTGLTNGD